MSTTLEELNRFRDFAEAKLSNGESDWSLGQLVELWHFENPTPEQREADFQAVKEALRDLDNGDCGEPLEDVMREIRDKHGLPQS